MYKLTLLSKRALSHGKLGRSSRRKPSAREPCYPLVELFLHSIARTTCFCCRGFLNVRIYACNARNFRFFVSSEGLDTEPTTLSMRLKERGRWENVAVRTGIGNPQLRSRVQRLTVTTRAAPPPYHDHSFQSFLKFLKFRIGEFAACHCGTSPMTVEQFLQDCQTRQNLKAETWSADTPVREIYGHVENLQRTSAYVRATREFLSELTTTKKKKS